jgi:hypothetical protein
MESLTEAEIRSMPVREDSSLTPQEKETTITLPTDLDEGTFSSEVATTIKWFLSVEETEITDYRVEDGYIVHVRGRVPKSVIKLQSNSRKSSRESQMVSYGDRR